jgi:UDP-N-acetylmuramoylalanine--D-glutamate ligase
VKTAAGRSRTLMVLGLARSGLAAARLAAAEGWTVLATDDGPVVAGLLSEGSEVLGPATALARIGEAGILLPSPGVAASHPLIRAARAVGTRVAPEIEFAAERLGAMLLAVTGTNGKSTVASLLGAILKETGRPTFAGGNLGDPLCNAVGGDFDFVVAEVSSFQLEHVTTFHPHIAAFLNLTPDHLDRHGDLEGYLAAKLRLFACMTPADHVVLPREGAFVERALRATTASVTRFDPGEAASTRVVGVEGYRVRLPERGWPELPHDLENVAAAVEMARLAGAPVDAAERAIAAFRPLAHRLARVAEVGGVAWWNDSKATNVGAACSSLRAFEGRVVLLAGGVSKGCDFGALASEAARITLVVAFGQAASEIEAALSPALRVVREPGLEAAVRRAAREAVPGDSVLLAPACASFDEFRDYTDRGRSYERWVQALQAT